MNDLELYFLEHQDEEEEFIEEMARLYGEEEIDYPEDWDLSSDMSLEEWLVYA